MYPDGLHVGGVLPLVRLAERGQGPTLLAHGLDLAHADERLGERPDGVGHPIAQGEVGPSGGVTEPERGADDERRHQADKPD